MKNYLLICSLAVIAAFAVFPSAQASEKAKDSKAKEAKSSSGHAPQGNAFTRFWIHTVGAPMAKGMKDGTRKVYKGLRKGTHMTKEGFMTIGGYKKDSNKDAKGKDGKKVSGTSDYPQRRDAKGTALSRYPGLQAEFDKLRGTKTKTADAKKTAKK